MKKPILCLLILFALCARADKITLANGEFIEGTILGESPDSVEIEYQFTSSIKDVKIVPRAEIAKIEKTPPDEAAYAKIAKLVPLPDMSPEREYRRVLDKHLTPFLTQFPESKKAADVKRMVEALESELKRIGEGDFRINGVWVTPEEHAKRKHYYDGLLLRHDMNALAAGFDYPEAMRKYEELRKNHFYTEEFPEIFASAKQILAKYRQRIEQMIVEQPILQKKRENGLLTITNLEELKRTRDAIEKETADFAKIHDEEKKANITWNSINPYHMESLEMAKAGIEKAQKEMDSFSLPALASWAGLVREAQVAAENGDVEKMTALFAEALSKGAPKELIEATQKSFLTVSTKPTPPPVPDPVTPGPNPENPGPATPDKPMPETPSVPDKVDDVDDLDSVKSPTQKAMEALAKERVKNAAAAGKDGDTKPAGSTASETAKEIKEKTSAIAKTAGDAIAKVGDELVEDGLGTTNLFLAIGAGVLVIVTIVAWFFNKRKQAKQGE